MRRRAVAATVAVAMAAAAMAAVATVDGSRREVREGQKGRWPRKRRGGGKGALDFSFHLTRFPYFLGAVKVDRLMLLECVTANSPALPTTCAAVNASNILFVGEG